MHTSGERSVTHQGNVVVVTLGKMRSAGNAQPGEVMERTRNPTATCFFKDPGLSVSHALNLHSLFSKFFLFFGRLVVFNSLIPLASS